ncbi:MAG: acyl carrier protein [Gemmatimonadetes bacterium]|nr:acyl carrier protein [Gemmatimonadota bacterium]
MNDAGAATAIGDAVEAFVRRRFEIPASDTYFSREINLWDEGYVDSLGMTELIVFLESSFEIKIPDSALFSPEFTSIDGIAKLVVLIGSGGLERPVSGG